MIVERAPAEALIPQPLELLDASITEDRPLGTWSRATAPALVLGSGQRPPDEWQPPAGLALVRRGTGGGAVICDDDYLMLDVALPPGDPRIVADVTESYRWLAEQLVAALCRLGFEHVSLVQPPTLRGLGDADREAARTACFAGLGPYELLDAQGHKLIGLAQRRRRGAVLLQAAGYLGGGGEDLADMLWLDPAARDDLRRRLRETAVLGAVGLQLPEQLGQFWRS